MLSRALKSVVSQTYKAKEIIVVDNGSTDGTEDLVKKSFPQVKFFSEPTKGVSNARNLGIRKASGYWIAFLDSDDEWLSTKLEQQITSYLQQNNSFKLIHTNETWLKNNKFINQKRIHEKSGGDIFSSCLPRCVISPSSVLMKRLLLQEVGCFDTKLLACEDYDLWLRVTSQYPVLYLSTPLVIKHGGHKDQLSKKFWGLDRFRIYALEKLLLCTSLTQGQKKEVVNIITEKLQILIKGAKKRNNNEFVTKYNNKLKKWTEQSLENA